MRIVFDHGTPVPLRSTLGSHVVVTAFELGWHNLTNGDLLQAAEADGFDVLVTTDQRLKHQQNLSHRTIAILVLTTTSWPRIRPNVKIVAAAIDALKAGDYRELSFPEPPPD
jgi:hypothetical protein